MFEALTLPFFQRGLIEILILAVPAGLIGSWVILRGLAFFSHAIGTASFPGLVLAEGLGFPAWLGAFGAAGAFAGLSFLLGRVRRTSADTITAMVLVGSLALGVILASDVFGSGAAVDSMLFGSLLSIGFADILMASAAAVLAVLASLLVGHHWLAKGFDEGAARQTGSGAAWLDAALLVSVAVTVTACLGAVGALLVSVLIVVPAATVRLVATRLRSQLLGSVLLVAAEGSFGLWLSFQTDAPPGATIAVVSGVTFALVLAGRQLGNRRALLAAAALALTGLIAGCGSSGTDGDGIKVVATTTQVGDLVREAGGDQIELTTVLKPNTDPHEYEPRPSDVRAVADATLLFRSGGHLDHWAEQLVADSGSEARVIDLGAGLPVELENGAEGHDHGEDEAHGEEDHHHEESHDHGEVDPHWWHDPVNVRAAAGKVAFALGEADRDQAGYFNANAARFKAEVVKLDRQIAACVRSVPADRRKIVTDHDAFGYFSSRYGIETVGTVIPALTTQAEPSAGDLAELERTIKREGVKAIFPESSLQTDLAEAIGRDTGASSEYSLFGDSLGPEGSGGETWVEMMKANADNLMLGLTGGKRNCFGNGE